MWGLNCFTACNLFRLWQVPGTWTKNASLSLPLPRFSPKALVCVGMLVGDCCHRKYLHVALALINRAFCASDYPVTWLPSNTCHSVDGSRFCSLHKSFGGSFHFSHQSKKAIFGDPECSLPDGFSGVSLCQPKDSLPSCPCAFAVPSSSPALNLSLELLRHYFTNSSFLSTYVYALVYIQTTILPGLCWY